MAEYEGRVSGKRVNMLTDAMVERFWYWVEFFEEALTEDGYAPFTEPVTERQQYERLVAWYLAGDQRFWGSPDAELALQELERQFGPRPVPSPAAQASPRLF